MGVVASIGGDLIQGLLEVESDRPLRLHADSRRPCSLACCSASRLAPSCWRPRRLFVRRRGDGAPQARRRARRDASGRRSASRPPCRSPWLIEEDVDFETQFEQTIPRRTGRASFPASAHPAVWRRPVESVERCRTRRQPDSAFWRFRSLGRHLAGPFRFLCLPKERPAQATRARDCPSFVTANLVFSARLVGRLRSPADGGRIDRGGPARADQNAADEQDSPLRGARRISSTSTSQTAGRRRRPKPRFQQVADRRAMNGWLARGGAVDLPARRRRVRVRAARRSRRRSRRGARRCSARRSHGAASSPIALRQPRLAEALGLDGSGDGHADRADFFANGGWLVRRSPRHSATTPASPASSPVTPRAFRRSRRRVRSSPPCCFPVLTPADPLANDGRETASFAKRRSKTMASPRRCTASRRPTRATRFSSHGTTNRWRSG